MMDTPSRKRFRIHKIFVPQRVEDAIRHQPLLGGDEVVILHAHAAIGDRAAAVEEIAQDLFPFRVDTQHRSVVPLVLGSQLRDVLNCASRCS